MTQLITVCRLVPAKGIDILLHACAELKRRGSPFVLHIIGDGPIREELELLAQELGLYDDIIFYGYMLHPEEFMPFSTFLSFRHAQRHLGLYLPKLHYVG